MKTVSDQRIFVDTNILFYANDPAVIANYKKRKMKKKALIIIALLIGALISIDFYFQSELNSVVKKMALSKKPNSEIDCSGEVMKHAECLNGPEGRCLMLACQLAGCEGYFEAGSDCARLKKEFDDNSCSVLYNNCSYEKFPPPPPPPPPCPFEYGCIFWNMWMKISPSAKYQ